MAAFVVVPAFAQPSSQTSRVPTVTRLVKLFSELEAGLATKAQSADAEALDMSLDPSFEMRIGAAPGVPVPRAEWIRQARGSANTAPRIDQMAVHDFGDVAVVSFRETTNTSSPAVANRPRFVVDCWKRDGSGWKLAVRYQSEVSPESAKRAKPAKTIDKRY